MLISIVVALAVAQIVVEDVIVFLGATGTAGPAVLRSPFVMVAIPFVIFLLLVGTLFAWALTSGDESER